MTERMNLLDDLRREVNINLAFGPVSEMELVTNDAGDCPVIVALDEEPLSVVLGRVRAVGGYGTVFSRGRNAGGVRMVSLIRNESALTQPSDDLSPDAAASFGLFLDYVETQPDGVSIPAAFDRPATAKDARQVQLASS